MTLLRFWRERITYRFLGNFSEVRMLRGIEAKMKDALSAERTDHSTTKAALRESDRSASLLEGKLDETTAGLEVMTDARLNLDKSHEFLRGELDALKQAHASEVDGLKRVIDYFAPMLGSRTIFGLAPGAPAVAPEQLQPMGARTRRSTNQEAIQEFYREAEEYYKKAGSLPPNPNGDPPADFSSKP